jgi:citrate lyase subunit beta/citryl-CoA lyase
VLVDVRAAGVPNPVSGLVSGLDGADVETFARQSRALGYEGVMVIHPAHVPIANAVFTPSEEERAEARAVLAALADAQAQGLGAVAHEGRMVDLANVATIRALGLADPDEADPDEADPHADPTDAARDGA